MIVRVVKRLLLTLLLVEVVYLVGANIALNSSWVMGQLNELRPDRVTVTWKSGWTLWPLKVHINGLAADGQTHNKQWQVDAKQLSGRVQLLPLLRQTIRLSGLTVDTTDFRLRPRVEPERDWTSTQQHFPVIRGRDPASAATERVRKTGKGWQIEIADAQAQGEHSVWLYHIKTVLTGTVSANLNYVTRQSVFSLTDGAANLRVSSLAVGDDEKVTRGGSISGTFSMDPFVPSSNRGLRSLRFLTAQAAVSLDVANIDFLNVYTTRFDSLNIDGAGLIEGVVHWQHGDLIAPTKLLVSASTLHLHVREYRITGRGDVMIQSGDADAQSELIVDTRFNQFTTYHTNADGERVMFMGDSLSVKLTGDNHVMPGVQRPEAFKSAAIEIPSVAVPDLKMYQHYLPQKWPVNVNSGTGVLSATLAVTPGHLDADIRLTSDDADLAFKQYRFMTGLSLQIKANGNVEKKARLDFSGTSLTLEDARIGTGKTLDNDPWQARLELTSGALSLLPGKTSQDESENNNFRQLLSRIGSDNLNVLLNTMNADCQAALTVSDIGWLNHLFKNSFRLNVRGSGMAHANIAVRKGWITRGSTLTVEPNDLQVNVLDYAATGNGLVTIKVDQGGSKPDMTLSASIDQGQVRHLEDNKAVIDQADVRLVASARDVSFGEVATVEAVSVEIPRAYVTDVTAYNAYLPSTVPMELTAGQANLNAAINLTPTDAQGKITFRSKGLKTSMDEQLLSGVIDLDVEITGGTPKDMTFRVDGSSIGLREFRVDGDKDDFETPGWAAHIRVDKGQVTWKRPMSLTMEAGLVMDDSRPMVALMSNHRGKHGWLEKLATVENINGNASVEVRGGQLRVPYAFASSDKVDVGAKGLFNKNTKEGVLFARYRKLKGVLLLKNDDRNFDVLGATRKFKDYVPAPITSSATRP